MCVRVCVACVCVFVRVGVCVCGWACVSVRVCGWASLGVRARAWLGGCGQGGVKGCVRHRLR